MVRAMSNAPGATPEELFARLTELGIRTATVRHAAVFTVEEAQAQRAAPPGAPPGAGPPFAVINDRAGAVRVVIDRSLLDRDPVNCHPLRNDMTTAIAAVDLLAFLAACGNPPPIPALGG